MSREQAWPAPNVSASAMHVRNSSTGEVYYTKGRAGAGNVPASLVKLMTAYVLLRRRPSDELLAEQVTITSSDLKAGYSGNNLQAGDVIMLRGLLVNAMLASSNNACSAIARVIGQEMLTPGNETANPVDRFIGEMNVAAGALLMTESRFVDPHGLGNENRSSPGDIITVAEALWENEVFRAVVGRKRASVTVIRNGVPSVLKVASTNPLRDYPGVRGGKTGSLSGASPTYNLLVYWTAPNKDLVIACSMGSPTADDRQADMAIVLNVLPTDFQALGCAPSEA